MRKLGLWSTECSPAWIVPIVPSGREAVATAWLARHGIEAWYPTDTVYVHESRPPHMLVPRVRAVAAGYLFVHASRVPVRDFWVSQSGGKIRDIFHFGERIVMLDDSAFDAMTQIPDRIRDLRQADTDMRAAADEAKRIKPGDTVTILSGGMAGWQMTVEASDNGVVRLASPLGAIEIEREKVAK